MRKSILYLFLFLSLFQLQSQELDKTYFLLGTLHDYMGREYPIKNPLKAGYIMTLHQKGIGKIWRIEAVIEKKFHRKRWSLSFSNYHEFYELKSRRYEKKINSFYKFEQNEWMMKDLLGFSFYTGKLNCNKLIKSSEMELKSFITGQFLTTGSKAYDYYVIKLYNSLTRFDCLVKVLKVLECEIIKAEVRDGTPGSFTIKFRPKLDLKTMLDNEILQRNTLANSGE